MENNVEDKILEEVNAEINESIDEAKNKLKEQEIEIEIEEPQPLSNANRPAVPDRKQEIKTEPKKKIPEIADEQMSAAVQRRIKKILRDKKVAEEEAQNLQNQVMG